MVLRALADRLQDHSDLRMALSNNHVSYEEALTATLDCVRGLEGRIILPTTNPARCETLRQKALENMKLFGDPSVSPHRRIRPTGKLESAGFPEPLSPERRELLKKKLLTEDDSPPPSRNA